MQRNARMKRELQLFQNNPPHGITCFVKEDSVNNLEAQIIGPEGTPYERGIFKLDIQLPERYPFEPPKVCFITPIYHPNIDNAGRICLDSLKMPPKGAWKPSLNICTVLTSVQLLMSEPNPEDPLMTDIANEFKYRRTEYNNHAQDWTRKHAIQKTNTSSSCDSNQTADSTATSAGKENDTNTGEAANPDNKAGYKKRQSGETASMLTENVKRSKDL